MAFKQVTAALKNKGNLFSAIKNSLGSQALNSLTGAESFSSFQSGLGSIQGTEGAVLGGLLKDRVNDRTFEAFNASLNRKHQSLNPADQESFNETVRALTSVGGLEGFSLENFKGSETDLKAANLTLNAQSHLQTAAAEALFTTITVRYEDEGALLKVRAAGLGSYAYGNSAWQSASELRPIFGLLRSGEMFKDEVLALNPVYPADDTADTRALFVDPALVAPTTANYADADAYGRQSHLTQYLKVPCTIPNLLGLCQAPGQRPWTTTDEIESNSICVRSLAITGKLSGTDVSFFVNSSAMSNNTFAPTTIGQSSDDRSLQLHIRDLPGFSVLDKDGNAVGKTLFASFETAGYEPMLNVNMSGNFQRQTNELRLQSGTVEVHALRDIATGVTITIGKATDTQKALFRSLVAQVVGLKQTSNVSNTSRGNFGYRIEVFDADKRLSVRRNSPVSVKYPITADDVNQSSLDYAIEQMSVVINNYCSKKAFEVAQEHLKYITSIDGAPVVGNNQGSNVLPGQHYVSAAAVNHSIKLADSVSSQNSMDVFDNVTGTILNELSDITSALLTKSGLAAIAEYGGVDKITWSIIVHQNLARFLMRSGDARSIGPNLPIEVVETNFDSQIGQILIVPRNNSSNEFINPLGGIGVNVSKENILVQGNVTRDQQDFGVVMTLPTFRHWALNPVVGSLTISDADQFLGNEGLLVKLAKQAVSVTSLPAGTTTTTP